MPVAFFVRLLEILKVLKRFFVTYIKPSKNM